MLVHRSLIVHQVSRRFLGASSIYSNNCNSIHSSSSDLAATNFSTPSHVNISSISHSPASSYSHHANLSHHQYSHPFIMCKRYIGTKHWSASSTSTSNFSASSASILSSNTNTNSLPLSDHASPDDIEEPDPTRLDAVHAHDAQQTNENIPLQGLGGELSGSGLRNQQDVLPSESLFTQEELAALIEDLTLFRDATAKEEPPATTPPIEASTPTAPSSSSPSSSSTSTSMVRPYLAAWSVKEVASWYLQVAEQFHLPASGVDGESTATAASTPCFVTLLQKHAIDGARLLSFTTDPAIIPLLSPVLLSRILYLRGLDTYSHLHSNDHSSSHSTSSASDDSMRHLQDALNSTVKIFCTSTSPDYARPWSRLDQSDATSSGFIISGKRILCNAHGVTSATQIRVRKHGDATKYKATVRVISHEADLAILDVQSDKFWSGLKPLQFGSVPRLQDTVVVVGYPSGGDSICVTKGVVSRILVSNYVHSDESLLVCQIDAAINSGNSGGPVLLNNSVVGVAFQGVSHAQSVGFIIPVPVVQHFLSDLRLHNEQYTGFPSFSGLSFQKLENDSLKRSFGMKENETGILVMSIPPLDTAHNVLKKDDVITHIDGIQIADDGSIYYRHGERINARYLPSSKFVGDMIRLRIIREKQEKEVSFPLQSRKTLVPTHLYDQDPSYFIFGGLIFTILSRPYLIDTFGHRNWMKKSPIDLIKLTYYGVLEHQDQEVVILSTILIHDVNTGYGSNFFNIQLEKVNGKRVRNLKHLVEIVEEEKRAGSPFLRFDFTLNRLIILDTAVASESTQQILEENNIEYDRSRNLREELEEENEEDQDATSRKKKAAN